MPKFLQNILNILKEILKSLQTKKTIAPAEVILNDVKEPEQNDTPEKRLEEDLKEILPARDHLYDVALTFLGKDASPRDVADDELGCAESVCNIIHTAFGDFPLEGGTIVSTIVLTRKLRTHSEFKTTLDLKAGNIIISPTGSGNGKLSNGHVGIIGKNGDIMSANSYNNGIWETNYTIDAWVKRYRQLGGFPILVFERI